jgi:hypothetical protein
MVTDQQVQEWAKQAGMHIATNFDREMFRRFAEVVIKSVTPEEVPAPRQKKTTDEKK